MLHPTRSLARSVSRAECSARVGAQSVTSRAGAANVMKTHKFQPNEGELNIPRRRNLATGFVLGILLESPSGRLSLFLAEDDNEPRVYYRAEKIKKRRKRAGIITANYSPRGRRVLAIETIPARFVNRFVRG